MDKMIFRSQSRQGRLKDWGRFPRVVLLDTTSFCNLRCSMCVHKKMKRKKGNMAWPLFTRLIDEIASRDKNTRVWLVFFGEPLILKNTRPGIFEMIRYAKQSGLKDVVLNSNANLLDLRAARELIASGLDAIYFGVDAAKSSTYSRIRVGGDYRRAVANITALLKLQKKCRKKTPKVFVQFVEMPENSREKERFIDFWKKKGAAVKIRPMVSWAGKVKAPNLVKQGVKRWPCYWAMQSMSVTNSGKVVTCAVDLDAGFVAGDAGKDTLSDIWNGSLKKLRRLHASGRFSRLPKICRDCRDWQSARADYY